MTTSTDQRNPIAALREPVRLRTLTTLRWLAAAGQTIAIVTVHFGFGFPTPLGLCLGAIAASAWLNLFTILRFSPQRFLSPREAAAYISFDIIQLTTLLFFTGGLQNPFSVLIIAPVTIAASVLPLRQTILISALAFASISLLSIFNMPLPWAPGETLELAPVYKAGVWVALSFSVAFFAAYAHRIATESAQMRSALAATQHILSREERLAAIGGLAAAAAHELGTPLATIQLTAKEMMDDLSDNPELKDDAALLVSQAERCRDILGRLSKREDEGDAVHNRLGVDALMKEAAEPFLELPDGPRFRLETTSADGAPEPVLRRRPEIIFGLRNFIENAADFAEGEVLIAAEWTTDSLQISVQDDGPGFSPDALTRLGEPYVTVRTSGWRKEGMGLGFFIAKTLLEGAGADIEFANRQWGEEARQSGASIVAKWSLSSLSAEPIA